MHLRVGTVLYYERVDGTLVKGIVRVVRTDRTVIIYWMDDDDGWDQAYGIDGPVYAAFWSRVTTECTAEV